MNELLIYIGICAAGIIVGWRIDEAAKTIAKAIRGESEEQL